ncbi:hypothetical protein [Candidatus Methanoperedens nitratireducens]|uniref:Uncharacterized protein n=1 Tax=Candidatus Methanoperedens nitratireducens TaxID=1392998 RepID=A0A284VRE0_9EURY|nr:hypothetical protein [Candidatus Methanoperedens nitroreducens]SNQ61851.1 exported hypothetical protein [Candidatus Methanoperedens nitroreducens]
MKNRQRLNILTSLVAAVFILSLFSGLAAAQTPKELFEKDKEQYRIQKERYENTQKKFEEAKKQFDEANEKLKNAKDTKSRGELTEKARNYVERAINHTIAQLGVLKSRIELSENKGVIPFDASKNIDAHIAELEQLRTKVQQATTFQELRDAHKELKDQWVKIRLETRYYLEILINHRVDEFITRAENVSTKLDTAIENAKAENKDVSRLQDDASRYKALVAEAKAIQQRADTLLANHSGFASDGTVTDNKAAAEFLRQGDNLERDAIKKMKSASKELLDFVRDYRKLFGKARVNEKGELEAGGSATATPVATSTVNATATATPTATAEGNSS